MSLVVVDTDVASALLRRRTSDTLARQLAGRTIAITFVTYGELTKWTLVRHWGPRSLDDDADLPRRARRPPLRPARRHPLGRDPGLRPTARPPRPVNDSWIAACCLVRELPLATFNIKDYADFAEHEGLELVH